MRHLINKKCLKFSKWENETLKCSCGKKIAIRYMINNEVRIFTYGGFKKYKSDILSRQDTQKITKRSDLLGDLGNEEWERILCNIKQRKENI